MKISAQEEYGLRILIRIASSEKPDGLTIPEISKAEGLSQHNVAKLCRILRISGFINSSRGQAGGYFLSRPADKIIISEVLNDLGGQLFGDDFCASHSGIEDSCTNTVDCSARYVWQLIQDAIDRALANLTLGDLINRGEEVLYHIQPPHTFDRKG